MTTQVPAQGRSARQGKLWKKMRWAAAGSAGPHSTVGAAPALLLLPLLLALLLLALLLLLSPPLVLLPPAPLPFPAVTLVAAWLFLLPRSPWMLFLLPLSPRWWVPLLSAWVWVPLFSP